MKWSLQIELTRFPARNSRTRVEYSVHSSSTAEVDEDFTLASSYVDIRGRSGFGPFARPAQRSAQIRIPIIHDSVDELDETIVIALTSANNGFNVDSFESQASGTITDHANDVVMVSVENSAGLEGDSGTNNIPVTLTLNIPSSRDIEVDWVTSESASGTNKATIADFVVESSNDAGNNPGVITAGNLSGTFNVKSRGENTSIEEDEIFTVTISKATNDALIAKNTAIVTIKDDEIPVLSVAGGSFVVEGDGVEVVNTRFTISSTAVPAINPLPVHFTVASANFLDSNNLPTSPVDITISDDGRGVITGLMVIRVHNDEIEEANGSIDVTLVEEPSGGTNTYSVDPAGASAKVEVRDDDAPKPVLSIAGPTGTVTEGENAVAEFVVTARESDGSALNPLSAIVIYYSVTDAAGDFIDADEEGDKQTETPVSFTSDGNGNYIYTISIPVGDDDRLQADGFINVGLRDDPARAPQYTRDPNSANHSATARVVNDDTNAASILLASSTLRANEGGTLEFVVQMEPPVTESTRVFYQILNTGTAKSEVDYTSPATDYVQFIRNTHLAEIDDPDNPGQKIANPRYTSFTSDSRQTIQIPVVDDDFHELSETVVVRLVRATGSSVILANPTAEAVTSATATILDDDHVTIALESTSAFEGNSGITEVPVKVTLDTISTTDLTVTWETKAVSGDTATAGTDLTVGTDFMAVSNGTVRIAAGETSKTFNVQIVGDTDNTEDNETFTVNITGVTPATNTILGGSRAAKVTIREDDRPVITIANKSDEINEGENAEFTITSTINPPSNSLIVNYTPVSNFILNSGTPVTPDASGALTFQQDGSVYTATLSISTDDDPVKEQNGLLTVTLDEGNNSPKDYYLGDTVTASVHVSDNDARNIPSLTIAGPTDPVFEGYQGGSAVFTITASVNPERTMDVRYTPSESGGDFLASDVEDVTTFATLDFTGTSLSDTISIPIEDDAVLEDISTITVTLEAGIGKTRAYTLGSPVSAMATIYDDDAPILSISAGERVIEGVNDEDNATFIVTTNKNPETTGTISVEYSFDRKYFGTTSGKTGTGTAMLKFGGNSDANDGKITGPSKEIELEVPINPNNETLDPFVNGELEVTLSPDSNSPIKYVLALAPDNSATVAVVDNDVPELSIAAGPQVIEGNDTNASFEVTATTSPNVSLPVKISFDRKYLPDTSRNKTGSDVTYNLDFTGGKTVATLILPLVVNNETIPTFTDGEFQVSLDTVAGVSNNYFVAASPNNSATVNVFDADSIPEINITPKTTSVVENAGPAMFTVTATGNNIDGRTIQVRYKPGEVDTGDFLHDDEKAGTDPLSIELTFNDDGSGNFTQDIAVELDDDSLSEATGEIEVVLHDPAANTAGDQFYAVGTQRSAKMTIYDDNAPELSIADIADLAEGTDSEAVFTVTAKVSPNRNLLVRYTVSQPGTGYDFALLTGQMNERLDFTNGKTSATIPISIVDDNRADSTGIIRVTLEEIAAVVDQSTGAITRDRQYTVSTATGENAGEVSVTDSDPTPMLTISSPVDPVAENAGVANYVISSTVDLGTGFTVRYDPSEVGSADFLNGSVTPALNQEDIATQAIDFTSAGTNNFVAILAVPIHDDRVGEDTGEIQVELLVGNNTSDSYNVATDGSQIKKATIHDDNAPVITIANAGTFTEWTNSRIEFPLTALVSPNSGFHIKYTVAETTSTNGNFIDDSLEGSGKDQVVEFRNGNTSAILFVPITSDEIIEGSSTVSVTLEPQGRPSLADAAWNLDDSKKTATATVVNYVRPLISFTTEYKSITKSTDMPFTVTMDPAPAEPVTIPFRTFFEFNGALQSTLTHRVGAVSKDGDGSITIGIDGTTTGHVSSGSDDAGSLVIDLPLTDKRPKNFDNTYRYTGALSVPIDNPSSDARITIAGPSSPVTLSEAATFTISADPVADKDVIVQVMVGDLASTGRNFVEDEALYVRLPANASNVTFDVPTRITFETVQDPDGNDVERQVAASTDGVIEARLVDGEGYNPDTTNNNNVAYAEIQDLRIKDPIVISATADSPAYYEGETISYTVSRTGDTSSALDFWYDLTETKDIIDGEGDSIKGTILANQSSVQITNTVKADTSGSGYGQDDGVTLRLISVAENTAATYRVAAPASVKIGVSSDSIPEITLSAPNYIEEGESFNLIATASPNAPIRATTINVTLSSDSNNTFLAVGSRGAQTIQIAAGQTTGSTSIATLFNGNSLEKGTITAQLETGNGYTRPATAGDQMTSIVALESLPEISMSVVNSQVREDVGTFDLVLDSGTFRADTGRPIQITGLSAVDTGTPNDYLGSVDFSAVEIDETGSTRVSIPVTSNDLYRGWGVITFTLLSGDEYDASFRELSVVIAEAQPHPSRTVAITAPDSVLEGEDIDVTFTSNDNSPSAPEIRVPFTIVASPEGFYDSVNTETTPRHIFVPHRSATLTISTFDDLGLTESGTIDITVLRGDGYEPASPATKRVQIIAKETIPNVSVNRVSNSFIDEGEDAVFVVSSTGTINQRLPVAVTITQETSDQNTSDFIDTTATPIPTSVDVLATTKTGEIRLQTIADTVDESNGIITVTLGSSSDGSYALTSDITASIEVRDNDDDTLPEISITQSGSTPVVEGDPLVFELTAANPPLTDGTVILVNVRVTETGDFLATPAKDSSQRYTVAVGSSGGTLSLPTTADADDEPNAKVRVMLVGEDTSGGGIC